jgi:hypothetical protein
VIKIGGANVPSDTTPKYITIENLDITSARPPYTFTRANGSAATYSTNASAIYIEKGENIIVRNCIIRDSGNGFFAASNDNEASRNILVEGNYIHGNGIDGSLFEHNNYTAAIGITFQFNRFGPLRSGCPGNNLKDRSAGLVVRYNWIEGGNRQLDLVDGEDSVLIRTDPSYDSTLVYGNVLIEPDGAGNSQITHYGGDSGSTADYRKGVLHFYNNTIVSTRSGNTTLFRLSTNDESCDFRNNIAYVTAAGNKLALVDSSGVLSMTHNWFKPGRVNTHGSLSGSINDDGTSVVGSAPGFSNEAAQDFSLMTSSACRNAGATLDPAVVPSHNLTRQYVKHQTSMARPPDSTLDTGAFEFLNFGLDTDADGIPDVVEANEGTNPLVKDNDVFGNPRLFVMQQYRDFLGREGDPGGVTFWTNQINSAAQTRAQVINSFFNSTEFQNSTAPVTRLYFAYFLRIPDYGGLLFWVNSFKSGTSLSAISNAFAQSAEFQARYGSLNNAEFVTLVYNNVLGRAPDAGGLAFWTGQLDSGAMTRGQVMLGFSESPEYKTVIINEVFVVQIYIGMLRRSPDQGGFNFWVGLLDGGTSGLSLIQGFLDAAEYRARFLP